MKDKILYAIIVFLVVLLLTSINNCQLNKQYANANLETATDTITYFINKLGTKTASIKNLQLTKSQLETSLIKKVPNWPL